MDKRKNNGGNSTKSTRPDDKRKSQGKALIDKYISEGFDYGKLSDLMNKLYKKAMDGDVRSASLFLSYVLGKPIETKDIDIKTESGQIMINYIQPKEE